MQPIERSSRIPSGTPYSDKAPATLKELGAAEDACTRCPLYRDATQAVPGEGPKKAAIMLVGEQPGDREDIDGHPFVGPAGRILDRALHDAGLERESLFVTNAVKHFKYQFRGKRRLHKRPNAYEVEQCRWWLDLERKIVKPSLTVAMGATAARSLFGRVVTISRMRSAVQTLEDGSAVVVTVHPSALLRSRDDAERAAKYRAFVDDLKICAEYIKAH